MCRLTRPLLGLYDVGLTAEDPAGAQIGDTQQIRTFARKDNRRRFGSVFDRTTCLGDLRDRCKFVRLKNSYKITR
jgi:hypothetical protein